MQKLLESEAEGLDSASVWADVSQIALRIPPLWDLKNYVAVNPYLGFSKLPIAEAARIVGDGLGASVLPNLAYYRSREQAGAFAAAEIANAARRIGWHMQAVGGDGQDRFAQRTTDRVWTLTERYDHKQGTDWDDQLVRTITRWCAVFANGGGNAWQNLRPGDGLYRSWLEMARVDCSLDLSGLRGFRQWTKQLPDTPEAVIFSIVKRLKLSSEERLPYFYRLLSRVYGWASYFRRSTWEKGNSHPGSIADLLAIRLCTDVAVQDLLAENWDERPVISVADVPENVEDESVRMIFQEALEDGYLSSLMEKLSAPDSGRAATRPAVQAVFCIDVRSEPFRRHLEAQSDAIETRGFAGFFGVSLNWRSQGEDSARCPVLLQPAVTLCSTASTSEQMDERLHRLPVAPGAGFSFVELLGLAYGVALAGAAVAAFPTGDQHEGTDSLSLDANPKGEGIPASRRLELAEGILKNMGFATSFARLILLCGHESHSTNNAHAASLDCGACGGHGGAINARVAAAILNDPSVRKGLLGKGVQLPADTYFVPAVHDTASDEIHLLDTEKLPSSHESDLSRLQDWLAQAGIQTRSERAQRMGVQATSEISLKRQMEYRSRDFSEVRPEWGLARNAAFIAARRCRTRGADLDGRAFLHEYDASIDSDLSILTLILSAPMVVASWINLQYFASTVDNEFFGCGDKALHNRVGSLGVVLGNGGDLRTGLPLQSVHGPNGRWFHEPLRLQVIVEAEQGKIDRVLASAESVKDLVDNGWVRLFALSPVSQELSRWIPGQGWECCNACEAKAESE